MASITAWCLVVLTSLPGRFGATFWIRKAGLPFSGQQRLCLVNIESLRARRCCSVMLSTWTTFLAVMVAKSESSPVSVVVAVSLRTLPVGESSLPRVPQRHRHSMLGVSPRECRVRLGVALRPTGRSRQQAGSVRQPMEAKPERR
ncbi:hypothetical protein MRX96_021693 [Rhipicephalus microplus]